MVHKIINSIGIIIAITVSAYIALTYLYKPDKFTNIDNLSDVNVGDTVNSDILNYYGCYFNKNTVNNLQSGSNLANTNFINNSRNIANKLNELSVNIDTLMIQLNNDILNNIGSNYARAHQLNKQREEMKKTLYDMPIKNI